MRLSSVRSFRRVTVRGAALSVAAACGVAGAAITAGPAAVAAQRASGRVVIVTCTGRGATSPATYVIACADGGDYLKGLNWSSWGVPAAGFGKDSINTCTPTCVNGKFKTYPVLVSLYRPEPWPHHSGLRYFSRMTLTYTKAIPKGFHKKRTVDLPH